MCASSGPVPSLSLLCLGWEGTGPWLSSANGNMGEGISLPVSLTQAASPAAASSLPGLQSPPESP